MEKKTYPCKVEGCDFIAPNPQSLAGHTYWSHRRGTREERVITRTAVWALLDQYPDTMPKELSKKLKIPYPTATSERHGWRKAHGLAKTRKPVKVVLTSQEKSAETDTIKKGLAFTTQIIDNVPDNIGDQLLDSFLRKFTSMEFEVRSYKKRVIDLEKELSKAYEEVDRIRKIHNQSALDSNKRSRIKSILG